MAAIVTVLVSGGVPVVDVTPASGTALDNPTTAGFPVTPGTGRPITIVISGAPPVVFIDADGVTYMPGGEVADEAPAAPVLTLNSLSSDNEPDFLIDLPSGWGDYRDAAAADHLILEYQLQAGGSWTAYIDHTLSAGDITDDEIAVPGVGAVSDGSYFFRARLERGALIGTNSANEAVTIAAATSAGQMFGFPFPITKAA